MNVTRYSSGKEVLARAGSLLENHEAENCLIFDLCGSGKTGSQCLFATVDVDHVPVLVAVQPPSRNLFVSGPPEARFFDPLIEHFANDGVRLPGVSAVASTAMEFAEKWSQAVGSPFRESMRQGLYCLSSDARRPEGVPGALRFGTEAETELLTEWALRFAQDSGLAIEEHRLVIESIPEHIRGGTLFVWDDAGPVSMVACGGRTPHGLRISLVYTPPNARGRGYATATVATLSQVLLGSGIRNCFLFADLANSTSNRIYKNIGYELVAEYALIDFLGTAPSL